MGDYYDHETEVDFEASAIRIIQTHGLNGLIKENNSYATAG